MRRRWTTLICFIALTKLGLAQSQAPNNNIVYNPSFEEHHGCPERVDALGVMRVVDAWWQPTRGSSDYFTSCGGRECLTPRNKMGYQEPHSGNAYCGIYCSQEHYREYLQTELRRPLTAGHRYRVSYWVSLADKSPHAVATLGALLTAERVSDSTWDILMTRETTTLENRHSQMISVFYTPQVENHPDSILSDSKGWREVCGEFTAVGGERFLTIGNFRPFNHSTVMPSGIANPVLQGAYYYIDDVSVVCLDSIDDEPTDEAVEPLQAGMTITIDELYFDIDRSEVLPQSYKTLHCLLAQLQKYPSMNIELRGHTDSQGTAEHNLRLSEARAKAVADYLIERGIDRRRITWKGFGKSMPIADNDTPEGREKNRRVEYRLIP